ncbi:MAG: dihydroneopterin aldolase [Bacteroidota bacterium]|nr:dihydroneopterin aldolase [Bacteroidota bacterium]MDP4206054.1 dihydroneopterin aldolase [Bacteroidota bacterium]
MPIIRVKNLRLRTFIGFNPEEKTNKQDVIINVYLETDMTEPMRNDQLSSFVDYKAITKKVIRFVEESRFNLLEALTQGILDQIMEEPQIIRARVEVDKPHALRFAESVSVELEAQK